MRGFPDSRNPVFRALSSDFYQDLIRRTECGERLSRLVTASESEGLPDEEALADPIGERALSPLPFLVQKFRNRVLYLASNSCASHCRFCFRRTSGLFASPDPTNEDLCAAVELVGNLPEVEEVILSGGDPLMLDASLLARIIADFSGLPNIRRLRIHTRRPVVDPTAGVENLLAAMRYCAKPLTTVFHVAHPAELTAEFRRIADLLNELGIGTQAQTVLLAGVNDEASILSDLFGGCEAAGLAPRYLHHPDRVGGAAAFRLPLSRGLALYRRCALEGRVPGYVIDLPDGSGKARVDSLTVVGEEVAGDRIRRRYRWDRPKGWDGVRAEACLEWWDIWEGRTPGYP